MAQEFVVNALTDKTWEKFRYFKDNACKAEEQYRPVIRNLINDFRNNNNAREFNFKNLFTPCNNNDTDYNTNMITECINYTITPEIKDYSDDESRVNDARHIRDNYTTAFITGERNIRSNRGYYAIILTLIILLNISSNDKIIDIEQLYLNLFEQWDIPVGYRNDICITVNDINMGANNLQLKNKILFLIMSIYMSILFDSFRNISYTLYKENCKDNLNKIIQNTFKYEELPARTMDDTQKVLEYVKSNLSGRIVPRKMIENHTGPVRDLFVCESRRIVNDATFVMYTGSSFLNVVAAERGIADGRLVTIEPQILDYLNAGGNLNIILTDPFSASADEAVFSDKLGNRNVNGTDTPFSKSYDVIKDFKNSSDNYENLKIKYTNISLPYSIMRMEFTTRYAQYNYIKIDLYSFGIRNNADRLSIIVFQDTDPLTYNTLSHQIEYITEKSYDLATDYSPEIKIFSNDEYETTKRTRVYFTGQKMFDTESNRGIKNTYSDIELGTSLYPTECSDKPHYHRTTNEHYMVVKGSQKILEINTMREFTANEGDVVFIPKLTPHVTKEAANTKIVFAKSPLGMDKEAIEISEAIQKWMSAPID